MRYAWDTYFYVQLHLNVVLINQMDSDEGIDSAAARYPDAGTQPFALIAKQGVQMLVPHAVQSQHILDFEVVTIPDLPMSFAAAGQAFPIFYSP